MKRETKLYNVMFPLWFLLILPASWIVVIPANFLIDLLVLFLTMKLCKMPDIGKNLKSAVLKTWLLGFAADLIGAAGMFLAGIGGDYLPGAFGEWFMGHIGNAVVMNPFQTIGGFLWTAFFVALAGFFIYLFNLKLCLNKTTLDLSQKKKLAISMAVFTAPYLFFLPTPLLY